MLSRLDGVGEVPGARSRISTHRGRVQCRADNAGGVFMRFTTRDLLWLMALAACGLACLIAAQNFYVDHNASYNAIRYAQHREDELRRAIQAEGYDANWNED